jgi:Pyruvate/2-oxoacid:ferredoxin oxidoreductase delta subunit
MQTQLYKKLADHLDSLPGGFPGTESGVELKILELLFTEEEAKLALHLTLMAENAGTIAFRAKKNTEETSRLLEKMASRGLILRTKNPDKEPKYMALQYVVGIWEFQVDRLTPKLLEYMEEYIPHLLDVKTWKKTPQMRTIPVGESIDNRLKVMTYENAYKLVESKKNFVISPCICRKEMDLQGKRCGKPVDTCISFGDEEDFYIKNNIGRRASKQEVIDVLKLSNKKGLVLQPSNGKDIHWLCCCCGCCCGILRTAKTYPKPADFLSSPFRVFVSDDSCTGCGLCLKRCPMDALKIKEKKVIVDYDRCIGCGLCVSTCPSETLKLERKPRGSFPAVSSNIVTASLKILHSRGKTSPMEISKMIGKSFFDRYKSGTLKKK